MADPAVILMLAPPVAFAWSVSEVIRVSTKAKEAQNGGPQLTSADKIRVGIASALLLLSATVFTVSYGPKLADKAREWFAGRNHKRIN